MVLSRKLLTVDENYLASRGCLAKIVKNVLRFALFAPDIFLLVWCLRSILCVSEGTFKSFSIVSTKCQQNPLDMVPWINNTAIVGSLRSNVWWPTFVSGFALISMYLLRKNGQTLATLHMASAAAWWKGNKNKCWPTYLVSTKTV